MPLYIVYECCKCNIKDNFSIWSIKSNNGYSYNRYLCEHFNIDIDHESSIGFFGIGWANKIKVYVNYKKYNSRLELINRTFSRNNTEYQNYIEIDGAVIHARISDYKNQNPICGKQIQQNLDIEYNVKLERQKQKKRREEERRRAEEWRREEERR